MNESFSVQLNPSNSAEFFGACGLLELAGRQTHAEGKFGSDDVFHSGTTVAVAVGSTFSNSTALVAVGAIVDADSGEAPAADIGVSVGPKVTVAVGSTNGTTGKTTKTVGVAVGAIVAVTVGVSVATNVAVAVTIATIVAVLVGAGVSVGNGVLVDAGISVAVAVAVLVGQGVDVFL